MSSLSSILLALALAAVAAFFATYIYHAVKSPRKGQGFSFRSYPMVKKDFIAVAAIMLVYGVTAFVNLGDTTAPQTFFEFNDTEDSVMLILDEPDIVYTADYYTGLYEGEYRFLYTADGQTWYELRDTDNTAVMTQSYDELFKWQTVIVEEPILAIVIQTDNLPLRLGEVVLKDEKGNIIPYTTRDDIAPELCDEQDTCPEDGSSWRNSAYFDEIYHPRTALEHIENLQPYEITHPPLGKIIISLGIRLFGMTPFGWRFMGCLFGILMLLPFYWLIKNMFGKTPIAICGTLIFAFDFMHFVQTRIATIDTYGVFFIILSYLFMWQYMAATEEPEFKGSLRPLLLSGLFFGIGCACKWIVVYAGVGLAVLYTVALTRRGLDRKDGFRGYLVKTLAFSVLGFVIVPAVIYCLSYIPYGLAEGMSFPNMLFSADYYKTVWDNQVYMLTYHQGVTDSHPYSSRWWQWIFDLRPILYYLEYGNGVRSSFGCFNDPLVAWVGLGGIAACVIGFIKRRESTCLVIAVGYLAQLLPWVFISRITFEYHYFPCTVFLVLAICYMLSQLWERNKKKVVYISTGVSLAMFPLFYPVLTGVWCGELWQSLLGWLPDWPF